MWKWRIFEGLVLVSGFLIIYNWLSIYGLIGAIGFAIGSVRADVYKDGY